MDTIPNKLQSKFVRRIMKGASEQEIEKATERWFEFLRILARMANEIESKKEHELEEGLSKL